MSNNDTKVFLQDAITRYDPTIDLSDGSRADQELVQPILQRIGLDPFDDDISTFVVERVRQAFPNLAITEADELTDTVIDPMRVLVEPLVREIKLVKLRSSLRNISSLADDEVDSLLGNFFFSRLSGGYAVGVVRIYFSTPQTLSVTQTNPATTRSGLRFMPSRPQAITSDEMLLNREGSEFYFDVNYTAEQRGDQYNIDPATITSVANLPTATRVKNARRFRGGVTREDSLDAAARADSSLSDKTLTIERGITTTLTEAFPDIKTLFSIGFRDPEMSRDVIKGGSLGPIPDPDTDGNLFGDGTAEDDLDGDLTTPILSAPTGSFISRLGAASTEPEGWFVTVTYREGLANTLVVKDVQVLEVISATEIRIDLEMPVTTPATAVVWALRERRLTISNIPGGITLPDTADGTLEIRKDEVHIGGKTDIYIAGETDVSTAQIESLTDQNPSSKGQNAQTQATDLVILNDVAVAEDVQPTYSLVLEEGVDVGSYRILEITSVTGVSPNIHVTVRLDTTMTGTQGSLAWRVVDEIDVELTDPKDIKVEGDDLVTAAGNVVVTTASATNFIDANIQHGDILEIFGEFGGEFTVDEVSAVSLKLTAAPTRTLTVAAYRIFRRSEAVQTPVVRVSSLELLDSTGAPSGTTIPYRDPVLALSNSFQNEGSGFAFEDIAVVGLVSFGTPTGVTGFPVGGLTIHWEAYNPDTIWLGVLNAATFTFSVSPFNKTAAQVAADLNADPTLDLMGIKARVITKLGKEYVGIVSTLHVRFVSGSALGLSTWLPGYSNAIIRSVNESFTDSNVLAGDLVEVIEGTSAGIQSRVIAGPFVSSAFFDTAICGSGPMGPEDTSGTAQLYNSTVFNPDVNVLVRIGKPAVGSTRVYFLAPTSAEFDYRTTRFVDSTTTAELTFRPDPENTRVVRPPPPTTALPNTGTTTAGPSLLTDPSANFLLYNIQRGDLLDVLYVPIIGTSPLPPSGNIAFTGLNNTLRLRLDTDPFITISFPFPMPRQNVVDFINAQVGEDVASLDGSGALKLQSSRRIELDPSSTAITHGSNPLFFAGLTSFNSDHPDKGTYIIVTVTETALTLSSMTNRQFSVTQANTSYRIRRYVQRISPTEMNQNLESSGLYFFDVQMLSMGPGDIYNISAGDSLRVTGVRSDGYRLMVENNILTFSRAEVLNAQLSRSIILVGSPDDPSQAVQLSQQNLQVTYDRSQLTDDVQSFSDSQFQRVLCEEILVRHLMPHYVSMVWSYAGGAAESEMKSAMNSTLDAVEPNTQLEVSDLTDVLRKNGATSVFTPDASVPNGRTAPFFVVVHHDVDRSISAQIVKDYVQTVRTQRYIPDAITLKRISTGGIR